MAISARGSAMPGIAFSARDGAMQAGLSRPRKAPRSTVSILGGPIGAAIGNRPQGSGLQQRFRAWAPKGHGSMALARQPLAKPVRFKSNLLMSHGFWHRVMEFLVPGEGFEPPTF